MKLRYGGGVNGYEILSAVFFPMAYVNLSKALVTTQLALSRGFQPQHSHTENG